MAGYTHLTLVSDGIFHPVLMKYCLTGSLLILREKWLEF